jgi:hypothetical protein
MLSFSTDTEMYDASLITHIFTDANKKVEMIELSNGNIFYDSEIKEATLLVPSSNNQVILTKPIENGLLNWNSDSNVIVDWEQKPNLDGNNFPVDIDFGGIYGREGGDTSGGG